MVDAGKTRKTRRMGVCCTLCKTQEISSLKREEIGAQSLSEGDDGLVVSCRRQLGANPIDFM